MTPLRIQWIYYWGGDDEKGYREYRVSSIFLLVVFVVLMVSCEKNSKISEAKDDVQLSESTDNSKDKLFSDDSGELLENRLKKLENDLQKFKNMSDLYDRSDLHNVITTDLLYRYEPYYIFEGWDYVEKSKGGEGISYNLEVPSGVLKEE